MGTAPDHIDTFGTTPDGRLFRGVRGGPVLDTVYYQVWEAARRLVLTPAEVVSPLAGRTTYGTPRCRPG